jgi:hypothetical protein
MHASNPSYKEADHCIELLRKKDPVSEITRESRAGGVIQVQEHLSSKHKALNSNPNITNTKNHLQCNLTDNLSYSSSMTLINAKKKL